MANIYELTQNYRNLMELLENEEVEADLLQSAFLQNQDDIKDKAENYCKIIKSLEADVSAFKEEEKRIANKRKSLENRIAMLKANLYEAMKATEQSKIKGKLFTLNIQKNPPSLNVSDIGLLPKEFIINTPSADTKAIKDALKNGELIEGCELRVGESLRIR